MPSPKNNTRTKLQALANAVDAWPGSLGTRSLKMLCERLAVRGHLAILREPYLSRVLHRQKTVESRLAHTRIAPFGRCRAGDVLLLKESSGPLRAIAVVADASSYGPLTKAGLGALIEEHRRGLDLDQDWIDIKSSCRYATFVFLGDVIAVQPRPIDKVDRRAWVVLDAEDDERSSQGTLDIGLSCESGSHNVQGSALRNAAGLPVCQDCGRDVINWSRLHEHPEDVRVVLGELRKDTFHSEWWTRPFDSAALAASERDLVGRVRSAARKRVRQSVGRVYGTVNGMRAPFRDGRQTPLSGNILFYAQHATATCCRRCIERWHGIPRGRDLTDNEAEYLVGLVCTYIAVRLPALGAED